MDILAFNFSWMLFNIILALVPVILSKILQKKPKKWILLILWVIWFLFLPNTIYLITDLQYAISQLKLIDASLLVIFLLMYFLILVLGVITYMYSLLPFEKILAVLKIKKNNRIYYYFILNLLISFAVVLGKFQRTHSWYVFTQPIRVINDILNTFSDVNLMILVILFWLIVNFIFISLRKYYS